MYHYSTYLKHYIRKPIQKKYYDKMTREWITMKEIITRELSHTYYYEEYYLSWCDDNLYVPYNVELFRKIWDDIYNIEHYLYSEDDIYEIDKRYLRSIDRIDVKRKSHINQNMILFYKNYFKRRWIKKNLKNKW